MTRGSALPAVVLGGGPIAVPVARSLHRDGVPVVALGHRNDPVRASRHCGEFVDTGAGEGVQERWLEWLTGAGAPRGVLLPCNDDALELIARHRGALDAAGHLPMEAADDLVLAMLDKERTYELARSLGVAAPRTLSLADDEAVDAAATDLGFPLALKPRRSHEFARHFGISRKIVLVADRDELATEMGRLRALNIEMLATEVIPGPDDAYHSYYTFIDEQGAPLLHITKHKLRQFPPGFGLGSYHLIHRDEETAALGLRFFERAGLRGLGNVEFKRDARDGRLVLIECNLRFTAGTEIVRRAGIDLARLAYDRRAGRPWTAPGNYRAGVRQWHPVEDARTFARRRRAGDLTFRAWARSLMHRQHFPLWDWRDPGPSLRSWSRFVKARR